MTDAEFETAFLENKDAVFRFAWRLTRSSEAAEDITQEVFVSLLSRRGAYDPGRGSLRSFLLGAVRNLAHKRWRSEKRWQELDEEQFVAEPIAPDYGEIAEIVGKAVHALPALQREVLILSEYEELSLEEIARVVDSQIGTVKSRLHRARENLRRMLAPLKPSSEDKESWNHWMRKN